MSSAFFDQAVFCYFSTGVEEKSQDKRVAIQYGLCCAGIQYGLAFYFPHPQICWSLSLYIYITSSTTSPIEPLARAIGERSFASQKLW